MKDADAGGYRSLADLCEALARLLRQDDEEGFDSEATYIQSFVDCVLDYSSEERKFAARFPRILERHGH